MNKKLPCMLHFLLLSKHPHAELISTINQWTHISVPAGKNRSRTLLVSDALFKYVSHKLQSKPRSDLSTTAWNLLWCIWEVLHKYMQLTISIAIGYTQNRETSQSATHGLHMHFQRLAIYTVSPMLCLGIAVNKFWWSPADLNKSVSSLRYLKGPDFRNWVSLWQRLMDTHT